MSNRIRQRYDIFYCYYITQNCEKKRLLVANCSFPILNESPFIIKTSINNNVRKRIIIYDGLISILRGALVKNTTKNINRKTIRSKTNDKWHVFVLLWLCYSICEGHIITDSFAKHCPHY